VALEFRDHADKNLDSALLDHHGLPIDLHRPTFEPAGGYVAFLGRICPEKRPDRAIEIARAFGIPLKIAAKVDKVDAEYFHTTIRPLLNGSGVGSSARSTRGRRPRFSDRPAGCCSRSTGRARAH
jgi:hypothetical protein